MVLLLEDVTSALKQDNLIGWMQILISCIGFGIALFTVYLNINNKTLVNKVTTENYIKYAEQQRKEDRQRIDKLESEKEKQIQVGQITETGRVVKLSVAKGTCTSMYQIIQELINMDM